MVNTFSPAGGLAYTGPRPALPVLTQVRTYTPVSWSYSHPRSSSLYHPFSSLISLVSFVLSQHSYTPFFFFVTDQLLSSLDSHTISGFLPCFLPLPFYNAWEILSAWPIVLIGSWSQSGFNSLLMFHGKYIAHRDPKSYVDPLFQAGPMFRVGPLSTTGPIPHACPIFCGVSLVPCLSRAQGIPRSPTPMGGSRDWQGVPRDV